MQAEQTYREILAMLQAQPNHRRSGKDILR